jgi:hypothetical protein
VKAFFAFLGLIMLAAVAFGFYVKSLDSCSTSELGSVECHKLYLAFGVLFAVALMLALAAAFYAFVPPPTGANESPGKVILDSFVKALIPIVTLVLGYYFGSAQPSTKKAEASKAGHSQSYVAQIQATPIRL